MNHLKTLGLLPIFFVIVACGTSVHDQNIAYKIKQPIKLLEYPPNLIQDTLSQKNSNTWLNYAATSSADSNNIILPNDPSLVFVRKDGLVWLQSLKTPNELWVDLKQFLMNIADTNLLEQNETAGLLVAKSNNNQDKISIRLEKINHQSDNGGTRIFVSYYENIAPTKAPKKIWVRNKIHYDLEAEILARLMGFLRKSQQPKRLKNPKISNDKVELNTDESGFITISSDESFANLWRRTHNTLKSLGIQIRDLDRSSGVFYVGLVELKSDETAIFSNENNTKNYQLLIAQSDNNEIKISVQNAEQLPDNGETAQRLIRILHQQLK